MASVRTTRMCKAECSCGRIIRVSKRVFDQGEIVCALCSESFLLSAKDKKEIGQVRGRWLKQGS